MRAPGEAPSPRPDIHAFTGLRAVAAWAVVAYHIRLDLPFPVPLQHAVSHGEYAVDLFFVMSGYVLALSYGPLFHRGAAPGDVLRFLGFRLARIYPAHAVVLALYVLIPLTIVATGRTPAPDRFDLADFAASAVLVQNWGLSDVLEWNIPAWSISAELMFYLAFPLVIRGTARVRGPTAFILAAVVLVALGLLGHAAGHLTAAIGHVGPLRCLLECTLGVLLLEAARAWHPGLRASIVLAIAAVALAALFGTGLAPDYAVMPAAILCLLWSLLEPRSPVARILANPVLRWLGQVSFATYIVHYLIKDAVKLLLVGHVPAPAAQAAYFAAVLAASAVLHHLVERPGQRAGQRLTQSLLSRLPLAVRTSLRPEASR